MISKLKVQFFLVFMLTLLFTACDKNDPFEGTSGTFTDERDGHQYKWVKIGEQIWMAENLAYVPYACAPDSQCGIWVYDYYGEGSFYENYTTYGCLYDWQTAMEVCPEGWHLPSDEEWMELERFLGMSEEELYINNFPRGRDSNVSGKLGAGMDLWIEKNVNATNEYGFTVLPGGQRSYFGPPGVYKGLGESTVFWTSSYDDQGYLLWVRAIGIDGVYRTNVHGNFGNSVRCIKN
ncbi:MAG TPA: FISUMP domain-containing protein [Draconibacterium sp.]|nr:FISUMP domain-containing protein [Draconibacterium sp.]